MRIKEGATQDRDEGRPVGMRCRTGRGCRCSAGLWHARRLRRRFPGRPAGHRRWLDHAEPVRFAAGIVISLTGLNRDRERWRRGWPRGSAPGPG
jgi:hypothetical protein